MFTCVQPDGVGSVFPAVLCWAASSALLVVKIKRTIPLANPHPPACRLVPPPPDTGLSGETETIASLSFRSTAHLCYPACESPSPPFRGEREGPAKREGEVGGAANEFVCATGNTPAT